MRTKEVFFVSISALLLIWLIGILLPSIPSSNAAINQTVLTKVNVTNTEPHVVNVTVFPNPAALTPGTTTNITCNATIWDYNGVPANIRNVTAVLYLSTTSVGGSHKNDTNYFINCTNATTISSTTALYTCQASVWYFATNGTWNCNVTAIDLGYLNGSDANTTVIQPLVALNVTDIVDYGNIQVLDTSSEQTANITNFGNIPINISVRGWGGQNESLYSNLSMICELGNISIDLERYNLTTGQTWDNMINLTGTDALLKDVNVLVRNDTNTPKNVTYWRIKIPVGAGGYCNGTLLFKASSTQ